MKRSLHSQQTLNKSVALFQSGKFEKAEKLARSVLSAEPRNTELLQFVAMLCQRQRKYAASAALCVQAAALVPNSPEAHYNLGTALMSQGLAEQAIASFERALALAPGNYDALNNLALSLLAVGKLTEAERRARQAISIAANAPVVHNTLGLVLIKIWRNTEAIESLKAALACGHPDPGHVWHNLAVAHLQAGLASRAIECFEKALAYNPRSVDLLTTLGGEQIRLRRFQDAAESFTRGLKIDPLNSGLLVGLAYVRLQMADWSEYAALAPRVTKTLANPSSAIDPYSVLYLSDDPAIQLKCAKVYAAGVISRGRRPSINQVPHLNESAKDKIRVAYLSADFKVHATTLLAAGLFEHHDRRRFETYAFAWSNDNSPVRRRVEAAFDHFIDVTELSDEAVSTLIGDHKIDIAVDLKGYTADLRPGMLSGRPAPIQVSYLGYPGTMGADWIDYLIADRFVIPRQNERFYSESIVHLPDSYQVNDSKRDQIGSRPRRSDLALPEKGFVFSCFNASYKITPSVFGVWIRLLKQVPDSVLWLMDHGPIASASLRREVEAGGIDGGRLVFAPRVSMAENANRLQCADLFLDTLPYNAHTTASDALWAGVPIVTCPGQSFQARVAGSLLHAIGLPELIGSSLADYEGIALKLASDPRAYAAIRSKLARNRLTTPLFDTARFTRGLEAAYEEMWQRWCQGLGPARIDLSKEPIALPKDANEPL